ncbi:protein of unknown function [Rhizobium sp. NFR07]|uniref:DMP19 family protein n=1 Tax=Rhizobium sp. NFR07 TaxID=1566262 RepID=UPI0008EDDAE6|nr:DUF4375 domain-containing protein [Rhizobium sp. NFR07]SFB02697.1 protein of unknown function [Rhizobium sp. NFR07]
MKFATLLSTGLTACLMTQPMLTATTGLAFAQTAPEEKSGADAALVQRLTVMSDIFVIEDTFLPLIMRLRYGDDKTEVLSKVDAFEPDTRSLFWLTYLHYEMRPDGLRYFFTSVADQRAQTAEVKKMLLEQGHSAKDVDATLASLDEMSRKTDPSLNAGAVTKALSDAGLSRQLEAFKATQALAARDAEADFSALDKTFGTKPELRTAIDAYLTRTPSLVTWLADARGKVDDDSRLGYLTGQLGALDEDAMNRLPKAFKEIYVVDYFNAEMLNGSVHQFFFNSSGDYAPEVVSALREIGLTKHADAVQRGIDLFKPPYPTDTEKRRQLYFSGEGWGEWDDKLSELTGDVDDGEITPALIALAKRENILPR